MNQANIKIIISPAKTFNQVKPSSNPRPTYLKKAKHIFQTYLKPLTLAQTASTYQVSLKLANKIYQMHQAHGQKLYNAIEVFGGLVFKQLNLSQYDQTWLNEHLLIIDPLYGPLKPYETIGLYRLDLKTKLPIDLKTYWKEIIEKELANYRVINLASKEYSNWLNLNYLPVNLDPSSKQIKVARGKTLHQLILKYQNSNK